MPFSATLLLVMLTGEVTKSVSDLRLLVSSTSSRAGSILAILACLAHTGAVAQESLSAEVEGLGVILSVNPRASRVTLQHEEIRGFMHAMTMEYPVHDRALLSRLKSGDRVRFVIRRQSGTIVAIQR